MAGLGLLLWAIIEAPNRTWTSPLTLGALGAGAAAQRAEGQWRRPRSVGGLDDRPQQQPQPGHGQQRAERVGGFGQGATGVGDKSEGGDEAGDGDWDVDQEDRSPPVVVEQEAAEDRPDRHPKPGRARPDADGPGPVPVGGEDVGQDG